MTALELLYAAYRMRVLDVPGDGFHVDDLPAAPDVQHRLQQLVEDGLLERGSADRGPALLVPTGAGLARIGVKP